MAKRQIFLSSANDLVPLGEVRTDLPGKHIKHSVFLQTGIPEQNISLQFNGAEVHDNQTLDSLKANESDVLIASTSLIPKLPQNVSQNSISNINQVPSKPTQNQLPSSPEFHPELQRQMLEHIRLQNVEKNMEEALQYNPESFASVFMLYVDSEVNGVPMKAFVDSGAQSTILSYAAAERCGLLRLLDRRFAGLARGVGSARILGRIHIAPLKLGNTFFDCSFTVLDSPDIEFLLGLDMLRKFQANIDLEHNVLRIGGEVVPFLHEKDMWEKPSVEIGSFSSSKSTSTREDSIQKLVNLGVGRGEALKALESTNWNLESAATLLANF